MGTLADFHDAVCDFLQTHIADKFATSHRTPEGRMTTRSPTVLRGGTNTLDDSLPFILPKIYRVQRRERQSTVVTLDVVFGVCSTDDDAYANLLNLTDAAHLCFFAVRSLQNRYATASDLFEVQMPHASADDGTPKPCLSASCRTEWMIPTVLHKNPFNK